MTRDPTPGQAAIPGLRAAQRPTWKEFQRNVVDLGHVAGWTIAQFRPLLTKHGWRTPVSADGAGFPDLVLVGRDQVLFRELKSGRGRLTVDQEAWLELLARNGADAGVWTDRDLDRIVAELGLKQAGV